MPLDSMGLSGVARQDTAQGRDFGGSRMCFSLSLEGFKRQEDKVLRDMV